MVTTTLNYMLADLRIRLGGSDTTSVWSDANVRSLIVSSTFGLYPAYYSLEADSFTADDDDSPHHPLPTGARNVYSVKLKRSDANRLRKVRGWTEGDGVITIPKHGIDGQQVTVSWTLPLEIPSASISNPDAGFTFPNEAYDVLILRSHVACLQTLLSDRAALDRYLAVQARQEVTEEDILNTIDAIQDSIRQRMDRAIPLPEIDN